MKNLLRLFACLLIFQSASAQYYPYLYMEDSTDYSRPFLMGIEDYQNELGKVELIGGLMIASGIDTFALPASPKIDQNYLLFSEKGATKYFISLTRKNYTQVEYDLWIEGPEIAFTQNGNAHLPTGFFLASETDESSVSGLSYPVYEYVDSQNDCGLTLRLGHESESGEVLLGSFVLSGGTGCPSLDLSELPTLQRQKP